MLTTPAWALLSSLLARLVPVAAAQRSGGPLENVAGTLPDAQLAHEGEGRAVCQPLGPERTLLVDADAHRLRRVHVHVRKPRRRERGRAFEEGLQVAVHHRQRCCSPLLEVRAKLLALTRCNSLALDRSGPVLCQY